MRDALYADQLFQILPTAEPAGLRLVGQADVPHHAVLERELERAVRAASDLHINARELESIDVGSARLIIDTAAVLALDARRLVIDGPRPLVLRSLRICGVDAVENVSVILATPAVARAESGTG